MNNFININEVLEAAILVEENGETFYRSFGNSADEGEMKKVFFFLADEGEHIKYISGGV